MSTNFITRLGHWLLATLLTVSFAQAAVPLVTTGVANPIGSVVATLNATVNAQDASATATFEYGLTTAYGTTVAATPATVSPWGDTPIQVLIVMAFAPGTTYHFRAVATNSSGTSYGADQTFSTFASSGVPVTGAPSAIGTNSATLNGTVSTSNAYFQYGLDNGLSSTTGLATPVTITGGIPSVVSAGITGLSPNTLYYFRVHDYASLYGSTVTFTTRSATLAAPVATAATSVSSTGFTANWSAVGAATGYYLDVATNSSFSNLLAGYDNRDVGNATNATLSGLATGGLYFYRVRAYSGAGTSIDSNTIGPRVVTNTNDTGAGSLRQTIIDAAAGETIYFDPSLSGRTITLSSANIVLTKNVTIDGSTLASQVKIDGGGVARNANGGIFDINTGVAVALKSLTLQNGNSGTNNVGGAIYIINGNLNVQDSTFAGNKSTRGGAIDSPVGSVVTLAGCTFVNNDVSSGVGPRGGALHLSNGPITIQNSTFSGNTAGAGLGGAMRLTATISMNATLINNSFTANTAGLGGAVEAAGLLTLTLRNNLFTANTLYNVNGNFTVTLLIAGTDNLCDDATCGSATQRTAGQINLGPLADNGGPTPTMALGSGSAALAIGNAAYCPANDQRGVTRIGCDVGAFGDTKPVVNSIAPTHGSTAGGYDVVISGAKLGSATGVTIGGVACSQLSVNTSTSVTCTAPAGSGLAKDVVVTTAGGNGTGTGLFGYDAPTVSGILPTSGPASGGTSVSITGTNFTGATAVNFGATNAIAFTVNSATQITASSPAGSGVVDITVVTPGGTSATSSLDQFTYAGAPTVTGISPTSGPTAGGTSVTITGTDFLGATDVSFTRGASSAASSFTVNSATQITATTPAYSAGPVNVVVTAPGGVVTATEAFVYEVPAPTVTGISPTSGTTLGGTPVTITGTNFVTGATTVTIGGAACASPTVTSATSLSCTTLAGTDGARDVVATTAGGAGTGTGLYTYASVPTVTAISPTSGPTAGGISVTVTGTNLSSATGVTIGGSACTPLSANTATSVTCTTAAHVAGTASVLVSTAGGTNLANTLFSYTVRQTPAISTAAGGGTVVAEIVAGSAGCSFDLNSTTAFTPPLFNGTTPPYGGLKLKLTGCNPGETVQVSTTWPSMAGLTFQKYGPTPTSNGANIYYTPNGVSVAGNVVTYSITDNGLGDDTFTGVDGVINDPAVPVSDTPIAVAIPTLSEWGMIILSGLLGLGTLVVMRRRRM